MSAEGEYGWSGSMGVATAAWRPRGQGRHGVRSRLRSAMVTIGDHSHRSPFTMLFLPPSSVLRRGPDARQDEILKIF